MATQGQVQMGDADDPSISADLQLSILSPRVQEVTATAGLKVKMPPAADLKIGGPLFYISNVGGEDFDITKSDDTVIVTAAQDRVYVIGVGADGEPFLVRFGKRNSLGDISDYVRLWIANPGALITGDVQFTIDNATLTKWRDRVAAIDLLATGSPRGRVPWSLDGDAPDRTQHGVRCPNDSNKFADHATAMSPMTLAAWTMIFRLEMGGSGIATSKMCGIKHDAFGGFHLDYNAGSNVLKVNAPGSTDGSITFAASPGEETPITVVSRFDGVNHTAEFYDEDAVLVEKQTVAHAGTVTNGDDFQLHNGVIAHRYKKLGFWNRNFSNAEVALGVANFQTEDLPPG